jgi:hypothetical protein
LKGQYRDAVTRPYSRCLFARPCNRRRRSEFSVGNRNLIAESETVATIEKSDRSHFNRGQNPFPSTVPNQRETGFWDLIGIDQTKPSIELVLRNCRLIDGPDLEELFNRVV